MASAAPSTTSPSLISDPHALYNACEAGDTKLVETILATLLNNPHVDHVAARRMLLRTDTNMGVCSTPLACACSLGHTTIVQLLLKVLHHPDDLYRGLCYRLPTAYTAPGTLAHACRHGHADVVKLLLAVPGFDPNLGNPPALLWACQANSEPCVRLLLKGGGPGAIPVDVNRADAGGRTALYMAAARGAASIVALLAEAGATMSPSMQPHPLVKAAAKHYFDTVAQLLKVERYRTRGNVNVKDCHQRTALMYAAGRGQTELVQDLLNAGAGETLNDTDDLKRTALARACLNGHDEVVDALLGGEVTPDTNKGDVPPLVYACRLGDSGTIESLLRVPETNINARAVHGHTPLFEAVNCGHVHAVKLLLKLGYHRDQPLDVNAPGFHNSTALRCAAGRGRLDLVQALVEGAPDLDCDKVHQGKRHYLPHRRTALMPRTAACAAYEAHRMDVVRFLLQSVPSLCVTAGYPTLLMMAASRRDAAIARLVVGHPRFKPNKDPVTPLSMAIANDDKEMVLILLRAGYATAAPLQHCRNALSQAVRCRNREITQVLLDTPGPHLSEPHPLLQAVEADSEDLLGLLLGNDSMLAQVPGLIGHSGRSIIYEAYKTASGRVTAALLSAGAADRFGNWARIQGELDGVTEAMRYLLVQRKPRPATPGVPRHEQCAVTGHGMTGRQVIQSESRWRRRRALALVREQRVAARDEATARRMAEEEMDV